MSFYNESKLPSPQKKKKKSCTSKHECLSSSLQVPEGEAWIASESNLPAATEAWPSGNTTDCQLSYTCRGGRGRPNYFYQNLILA